MSYMTENLGSTVPMGKKSFLACHIFILNTSCTLPIPITKKQRGFVDKSFNSANSRKPMLRHDKLIVVTDFQHGLRRFPRQSPFKVF